MGITRAIGVIGVINLLSKSLDFPVWRGARLVVV